MEEIATGGHDGHRQKCGYLCWRLRLVVLVDGSIMLVGWGLKWAFLEEVTHEDDDYEHLELALIAGRAGCWGWGLGCRWRTGCGRAAACGGMDAADGGVDDDSAGSGGAAREWAGVDEWAGWGKAVAETAVKQGNDE